MLSLHAIGRYFSDRLNCGSNGLLLAVLPKYNHSFRGLRVGLTDNHPIERGEPFGQVEFVERSSGFGGVGVRRMVDK